MKGMTTSSWGGWRVIALLSIFMGAVPGEGQELVPGVDYVPGDVMVLLKPAAERKVAIQQTSARKMRIGLPSLDALNEKKGVSEIIESPVREVSELADRRYIFTVPPGKEQELVAELARDEQVEAVSLNYLRHTMMSPNDTYWGAQWNFNSTHLRAEQAWDISTGSANVLVGIIDTGLDYQHPDLAPNMWSGIGYDFCGPPLNTSFGTPPVPWPGYGCSYPASPVTYDRNPQHEAGLDYSHGTKIAGVIAARSKKLF